VENTNTKTFSIKLITRTLRYRSILFSPSTRSRLTSLSIRSQIAFSSSFLTIRQALTINFMDQYLNKVYKFEKHDEHFNDYLIGIGEAINVQIKSQCLTKAAFQGLNFINRKLAKTISSSTQVVKLNEREYAVNTILPFKTHQQKFVPGEESEQTTVDGRKVRNIFTIEGNKITERQIEPNREVTIVREFFEKEMLGRSIVGKVINNNVSYLVE
jgi:hypothetical protein